MMKKLPLNYSVKYEVYFKRKKKRKEKDKELDKTMRELNSFPDCIHLCPSFTYSECELSDSDLHFILNYLCQAFTFFPIWPTLSPSVFIFLWGSVSSIPAPVYICVCFYGYMFLCLA